MTYRTPKPLSTFRHPNAVYDASFSPDGKLLASASLDNTAKIWDLESGEERLTLRGHGDGVCTVEFLPEGKKLVTASLDKSLRVWDVATGAALTTMSGHQQYVECMDASPDGRLLASGGMTTSFVSGIQRRELRSFR